MIASFAMLDSFILKNKLPYTYGMVLNKSVDVKN